MFFNVFYLQVNVFNIYGTVYGAHNHQAASFHNSTQPVASSQYLTSVLLITESWQCYRSEFVNILCEMLIS